MKNIFFCSRALKFQIFWGSIPPGFPAPPSPPPPPIPDKRGIKAPCCYSWLLHSVCWRLFGGAMPLETGVSFFILCLLQSFSQLLRTILKTLITHDYIHSKQKSNKPKRTSWLFNCPIARKN